MTRRASINTLKIYFTALHQRFEETLPEIKTIGEFVGEFQTALDHFEVLSNQTFLMLRSDTIEKFFEERGREGASSAELLFEAELLYSIFRYRDEIDNKRSANLVQMAITSLRTRGLMD